MKIVSAQQQKLIDAASIAKQGISSIDLMERAALACREWLLANYEHSTEFFIFCGTGNNGGDGLALARLLISEKKTVHVFVVNHSTNQSDECKHNLALLSSLINVQHISSESDFTQLNICTNSIIIDALLGIGINRNTSGILSSLIQFLNHQNTTIISIDIPTGLFSDNLNEPHDIIIRATHTLCFHLPKLSFMYPENQEYIGTFHLLNIHLDFESIVQTNSNHYFFTTEDALSLLHKRNQSSNKWSFGHGLLVSGSYGKVGAAVLCSQSFLKSGAGMLTVHAPKCAHVILQSTVPEAMLISEDNEQYITSKIDINRYDAIGLGPGLNTTEATASVIKYMIQESNVPLVIDADGLNILSENKTWLSFLPAQSVLTPHYKEFERLTVKCNNSQERLSELRNFAVKHRLYVVLKGAHTAIAAPNGSITFNSSGNAGMATAGSGDVLTGIITSLLAQGYSSEQASTLGVYLHGLAGDMAAQKYSQEAMTASSIINCLSEAFLFLHSLS
jgi:ADP-dependent NAD(P)H-hydrate dehydratase / NAD(P)H-hydrate epimerase